MLLREELQDRTAAEKLVVDAWTILGKMQVEMLLICRRIGLRVGGSCVIQPHLWLGLGICVTGRERLLGYSFRPAVWEGL